MPSVTRRPRSRDSANQASVEQALTGAMERLLSGGKSFTAVSVEELANEAGLARSTFYLHFRDKGELVRTLMSQVTVEIAQAADIWFKQPEAGRRDDVESAIRNIVAVYERHRAVMHAVIETSACDPTCAEIFNAMMRELTAQSRRAVQLAQAAGKGRQDASAEVANVLTWMVERCCHQVLGGKRGIHRERIIAGMVHVIWTSIYR